MSSAPSTPQEDAAAYQQYEAIRLYLDSFLQSQRGSASSQQREAAKDKMTKLSKQQFFDLSTDVYDEMNRRQMNSNEVPFLPVRDDLHPRRNQARQKLATLPSTKFKDLACDVFYEIERRFTFVVNQFETKYRLNEDARSLPQDPSLGARENMSPDMGSGLQNGRGDVMGGIPPDAVEKLRREYESRIDGLQVKLRKAEQDVKAKDMEAAGLNEKLMEQLDITKDLKFRLDNLQKDYDKLKEDYDGLQDDFNNQQQIASDIRAEATNLLEEIKSLTRKNQELEAERNRSYGGGDPRDDYGGSKQSYGNSLQIDDDGIIDRSRVTAYENAIDDLLRATRESPTNILIAMKAIVIACKNITEDTEAFESSTNSLRMEDKEQLDEVKNRLSSALQNLMTVAKSHATNFNSSPVALLENATSTLTSTIVELVRLLKYRQNEQYSSQPGQWGEVEDYEIDELKVYLERQTDQIVQAIQSLLLAMKSNAPIGQEFDDTVRSITDIVFNLVKVSNNTLNKPSAAQFRNSGEAILQDLSAANIKLEDLGVSMLSSPQSKSLKQKLASSSYEIAKYVKELISLIE
ncbi:hypothetical protein DFJ73DRAFT_843655 [Zopfochytrium polystomum]|nr:hypothetical protein DFJ73DRAFT_843655 [Zopfochytrium polystomum]